MHDNRGLVEARLRRELTERLFPALHRARVPLRVEAWACPGEPVPYDVAASADYETFEIGRPWGRPWGTTWFRLSGTVPEEWEPWPGQVEAVVDLGFRGPDAGFQAEALVWQDDAPLQGVHPRRTVVPLRAAPGQTVELLVEAAANPAFPGFRPSPMGSWDTAPDRPTYRLAAADLAVLDRDVFALVLDVEVLEGTMLALPLDDPRRQRLLRTLERAFDALDLTDVSRTAATAREVLAPALALPARAGAHRTVAVGHAHIDTAWLWPLRETVRKCTRTFASALRLMDDYADYRFVCSQAVQYEWMRQQHPALFARIQEKAAAGQWIPVGGMWVETDANIPSGESIVRQLVHGQRFFEEHFGRRCREVWIPDVFGYPASLPQIFAAAGCDRFVTQKLSWNKENRFPHSTFWWEGIDGTQVLTHFPPVETYNAMIDPAEQAGLVRNFHEHGWSDWSLTPYGYGNGGGGPTREMVERALRMADLDGLPRLELGTVDEFFEAVEAESAAGAPVPLWQGELYFEMHRGTLTSQVMTKVGNRRNERLLHEAELWWTMLGWPDEVASELDSLWKDLLVQQFHDILPGSSIAWVHADAEAEHGRITERLEKLVAAGLSCLAPGPLAVASARSRARAEVVVAPVTPSGPGPVQQLAGGGCAFLTPVPAMGVVPGDALGLASGSEVVVSDRSLSNGRLVAEWDDDGALVSIRSLEHDRELLVPGRRVELELTPDHPVEYDAWDLEGWARRRSRTLRGPATVEVLERGPLLGAVRVTRADGPSTFVVTYRLTAGSGRLDLAVDVDWQHEEHLLSMAFPLDVRAEEATCDIQFGHVRRPTHASSSWDAAKFEVCAHRFVDLSEPSFGVAVLNDGRYGHAVQGDAVRVSLLRAARYPDPQADRGRHEVTLALVPHGAGLAAVLEQAEALNRPPRVLTGGSSPSSPAPIVSVEGGAAEVVAVKGADDRSGDVVLRLHEALGDRSTVRLQFARDVRRAGRCSVLEDPGDELPVDGNAVELLLRPFELVSLRVRLAGS